MAGPVRDVAVKDLDPLDDAAHKTPRRKLQALSDDELLESCIAPDDGRPLVRNTRTGKLHDGNGRAWELKRRAGDPASSITPDTLIPVVDYTPDLSAFPDVDQSGQ